MWKLCNQNKRGAWIAYMEESVDDMRIEPLALSIIKDLTVELVAGINQIPRIHQAHINPYTDAYYS